jgi:hypothetical protein
MSASASGAAGGRRSGEGTVGGSPPSESRRNRGRGLSRLRRVLRLVGENGPLTRLQVAFLAMTIGEYGAWITILVYAYRQGGATAAGLVALAQLLPSIVLSPVVSAHGIRLGAARLLVACYLASTLMLAACAAGILLEAPSLAVYAGAICFTISIGVSVPLHNVLVPLLVRHPDELTAGNVVTGWCKGAGALTGPLIAGALIAVQGTGLACAGLAAVCATTPLLASVRPVRAGAGPAGEEGGGLGALLAAARVIAARPNTRALMAYRAAAAAVEGAIDLLVVLIAIRILAIGPAAAGYLNAAFGAGGMVGASAAVMLVGRHLARPLVAATLIGAAALAALTLAATVPAAVALLILVGATRSVQSISSQTLLQRSTPLDVIVCAFALVESLRDTGLAFGSLAIPVLVGLGGTDAAFIGMAAVAPLVVVLTLPRIRTIDREATIPVVEMGLLRNLSIFSALPAAPLETLAREASYSTYPAGAEIVAEGQPGDRYYAVTDGSVAVTKSGREVRRMGRGEGFGEIALLHPVNRTASVTALGPTTVLAVERDAFLTALNASPQVHEAAGRVAGELLAEAP